FEVLDLTPLIADTPDAVPVPDGTVSVEFDKVRFSYPSADKVSLDSASEAAVQQALGEALAGRTSIVIAHRLSTIRAADQILVIEDGRIVERGTHDQLQARRGRYAELYETQFGPQAAA
ncbi:MAG: hypothetical protein ACSLE6_19130, partial [Mycobacterium sp.]